jgi:hypothetical protein
MEVIAIIVIGGLLARFWGGRESNSTEEVLQHKGNNDWMRTQHLINEQRDREREEADRRRRN